MEDNVRITPEEIKNLIYRLREVMVCLFQNGCGAWQDAPNSKQTKNPLEFPEGFILAF